MPIRFACASCLAVFTVDDDKAGLISKCPSCAARVQVPQVQLPGAEFVATGDAPAEQDWQTLPPELPAGDSTPRVATSYRVLRPFYATPFFLSSCLTGLIVLLGAAAYYYWYTRQHGIILVNTSAAGPPSTPSGEPVAHQDGTARIIEHQWWTNKPTRLDVERFVQLLLTTQADHYVWINGNGATTTTERRFTEVGRNMIHRPTTLGKRVIYVSVEGPERFTPAQALTALSAALDWGLAQDGPGASR